jgi:hypothetical protein
MINKDLHYCKSCKSHFRFPVPNGVTADYFLKCPYCSKLHYRHFEDGMAVHCDILKTYGEPQVMESSFST